MNSGAESSQSKLKAMVREILIDINEKHGNLPTDEEDYPTAACSFLWRSQTVEENISKVDVFTPRFVGLGQPDRHKCQDLIVTDEEKRAAIKMFRADLAIPDDQSNSRDLLERYDTDTLNQLLVNGLFLLPLLRETSSIWYYFLSKQSDRKFTFGHIVEDVFMLENQIPTSILRLLMPNKDLGKKMKSFCKKYAPFYNSKELAKEPYEYVHLLDLAYHLAAPAPAPTSDQSQHDRHWLYILPVILIILLLVIWILLWVCIYLVVLPSERIISSLSSLLVGVAPGVDRIIDQKKVNSNTQRRDLLYFMRSVVRLFIHVLASFLHLLLPSFITKKILETMEKSKWKDWLLVGKKDLKYGKTGSASEMHKYGIRILATKGGVSSFDSDFERSIIHMPPIRLVDISAEVTIANLMTYEVSIRKNDKLEFTEYIQLMSTLIQTVDDVNVLVGRGIIQSSLQDDEDVVKLFKKITPVREFIACRSDIMDKSQDYKHMTMEAKKKQEAMENLRVILLTFFKVLLVLGIAFMFYPFLVEKLEQVGCSTIFNTYIKSCKGGNGTNNYLASSA